LRDASAKKRVQQKKAERQRLKQEKSDDRKDSGATSQPVDGDIADPFSKATDKDAPSNG
jgi:hypothetical protein